MTWVRTSEITRTRTRCFFEFPLMRTMVPGSALDLNITIKCEITTRSDHPGDFEWDCSDTRRNCAGTSGSLEAAKASALKVGSLLWLMLEIETGNTAELPEELQRWKRA